MIGNPRDFAHFRAFMAVGCWNRDACVRELCGGKASERKWFPARKPPADTFEGRPRRLMPTGSAIDGRGEGHEHIGT